VWVAAHLAVLRALGRIGSLADAQRMYFSDPTTLYTAGRTLGVACGTATVALVYKLGARVGNRRAGIAAALFLAVAPLHVRDSHYIKHDVPATLAVVAAYLVMTRLWATGAAVERIPATRDVLLSGAACGVAFAVHYYCVFLVLPLGWSVLRAFRDRAVSRLALALAASSVVFFALSPFIAVEPLVALRDIAANRQIVVDRAVAGGVFGPAWRYAEMLWRDSAGMPVIVASVAGALWMLATVPARAAFLLAFPVPFLVFISNTAPASRYLNPLLPFVALFAGWFTARVFARRALLFWTATVVLAVPGLTASIRVDRFFRQNDTRTVAQRFIEAAIPAHSTVLVQPYSVQLTPSKEGLIEALTANAGGPQAASTKFQLQLAQDPYPEPSYRLIYLGNGGLDAEKVYISPQALTGPAGLEPLRRLGVTFLVLKRYNRPDPETLPFLEALAREGRRIAAFSPYRPGVAEAEQSRVDPFLHNTDTRIVDALERPGPPLEIWQLESPRQTRETPPR
jgi:dolichyl-phosphate-mannose-protein mannosyltransferase